MTCLLNFWNFFFCSLPLTPSLLQYHSIRFFRLFPLAASFHSIPPSDTLSLFHKDVFFLFSNSKTPLRRIYLNLPRLFAIPFHPSHHKEIQISPSRSKRERKKEKLKQKTKKSMPAHFYCRNQAKRQKNTLMDEWSFGLCVLNRVIMVRKLPENDQVRTHISRRGMTTMRWDASGFWCGLQHGKEKQPTITHARSHEEKQK